MNDLLGGILSGLFSISGLVAFGLGVVSVYAWNRVKAVAQNRAHRSGLKKTWVVWAVVTLAVLFSMVQTQETWDCMSKFNAALQARSDIARENDALSRQQRDAFARSDEALSKWIGSLLAPPPEIAALPPSDPARREYGIRVSQEFNNVMSESRAVVTQTSAKEAENDKERAAYPLPELDCGR